jgi:STE24 endopeptidase
MLYIFSIFVDNEELSKALGSQTVSFQLGLIAFGILYSPISDILGVAMNSLSRKHEYEADAFARDFGQTDNLISALKKLSEKNLSNLTPHPWYVFYYYSHPTLYSRIKALKEN